MDRPAIALLTIGSVVLAGALTAGSRRSIDVEIKLPTGARPHFVVPENEGVIVPLPDHTQYGFVPVIREGESRPTVIVSIWEVQKRKTLKLGEVEAILGGPAVVSTTSPVFAIRILRVT